MMVGVRAGTCTCRPPHAMAEHRNGRGRCTVPGCACLFAPEAGRRAEPAEILEALKVGVPRNDGSTIVCWFSVPGEPVPKARPRFDQRHGRTYTPAATVEAEKRLADYFKTTYPHFQPCADPVGLRLRFHLKGVGRGDWDNYGKLVSDSLNGKAWIDDKQVRRADIELLDRTSEPRTDILVYRLVERLL